MRVWLTRSGFRACCSVLPFAQGGHFSHRRVARGVSVPDVLVSGISRSTANAKDR